MIDNIRKNMIIMQFCIITSSEESSQSEEPSQKYSAGTQVLSEQPRCVSLAHLASSNSGLGINVSKTLNINKVECV